MSKQPEFEKQEDVLFQSNQKTAGSDDMHIMLGRVKSHISGGGY